MKYLIGLSRIIVGSLFIVSGLIKSNDAIGFSFKLKEYFEIGALNLPFLEPYALSLSVLVCIAEILLGVAVLLGALPKLSSILIMVLMLFFTWLTFYTSTCDPSGVKLLMVDGVQEEIPNQCVLSCGCFGNAIPLTPIESFYKDLFLLVWSVIILIAAFFFPQYYKLNSPKEDMVYGAFSLLAIALFSLIMLDWVFPVLFAAACLLVGIAIKRRTDAKAKEWIMAAGILVVCGIFQWYTLTYLPVKDYRPYAVGENIITNMMTPEDLGKTPPKYVTMYTMTNKSTGESFVESSDDYMANKTWQNKDLEITNSEGPIKVADGYETPITDFAIEDGDGNDVTDEIIEGTHIVWIIQPMLEDTDASKQEELNAFAKAAEASGAKVVGLTASNYDVYDTYRHDYQVPYEFYTGDQKVLQTVVRSNPGIVQLKGAVVQNKWSKASIPSNVE